MSILRDHWSKLTGNIHPSDIGIFEKFSDHTFNLDFPPPAFTGDLDAPIIILMSNGGYKPGITENEFPNNKEINHYLRYLRSETKTPPAHLSTYYTKGILGKLIQNGDLLVVNAIPYRSPSLSQERNNQKVAQHLNTLKVHRRWLFDELIPQAKMGKRFLLVHRNGWWKAPPENTPCILFSDPAKAEPNRKSPDRKKLEQAEAWLAAKR